MDLHRAVYQTLCMVFYTKIALALDQLHIRRAQIRLPGKTVSLNLTGMPRQKFLRMRVIRIDNAESALTKQHCFTL